MKKYPDFLYRKDGQINASCLRESWFKKEKPEIYSTIEKKIKKLFPKDYIPSSYSEYLYVYFNNIKTEHICNNPNCDNVAIFKKFGVGFLDYCSKRCRGEHTKLKNRGKNKEREEIKKEKIRDKVIKNNKENILNKIGIDFFNIDGELNANKTKENYIKKNYKKMYKDIITIKDKCNNITFNNAFYLYCYNLIEIPKCKICKKDLKYKSFSKGYGKYCDNICSSKDKELHKIGMDKYKKRLEKKYGKGITSFFQTDEFKRKQRETSLKEYGTEYPSQSEEVKNKINESIIQKYGSKKELGKINYKKSLLSLSKKFNKEISHFMDIPGAKEKQRRTFRGNIFDKYMLIIKKDNISFLDTKEDFLEKGSYGNYNFKCKKCGNIFNIQFSFNYFVNCPNCNRKFYSQGEIDIARYISNINNNIIIHSNDRKILKGKELDILLPDYKIAIEYNGLLFHSIGKSTFLKDNNILIESELKNYHLFKTQEYNKQGIQLFHIFENEWKNKRTRNIWKNIILNRLGKTIKIYGRNTYIKLVSNKVSKDFLNTYHLQGNIPSKLKIGLFDKETNELLSLMTFGKSRFDKNIDWELLRFVTKSGINVIGGASKIFTYFLNNYVKEGESIKTYADLRFSNGNVYKKLGFEQIGQSKPNYFYFKNNSYNLESRIKYQKHKLKEKLEVFDEKLSESENMYNNGYRKIYDCGNLVFKYVKK